MNEYKLGPGMELCFGNKLPSHSAAQGRNNCLFKVTSLYGSIPVEIEESSRVRLHVSSFFSMNQIITGELLLLQGFLVRRTP